MSLAEFAGRVAEGPTPLLALRVVAFAETAWRHGRRAALQAERRCASAFLIAARRVLRASDLLGHDPRSAVFVAALTTPGRREAGQAFAADCRSALARIASAMELTTGLRMETGWTLGSLSPASLHTRIGEAFERGARERERYAFFSLVGHELRTPLTSIRGYLDALIEDEVEDEFVRPFLETARSEALRLGRFLDGMFELSLIDAGLHGTARTCDPAAIVLEALAAAHPAARARGIALLHELERGLVVRLDADLLSQVVGNVIDNALKYGAADGLVHVGVRALDARFVEVAIDDDGPGIATHEREAIFVLGYRSASGGAGSGIGLAVARLIVERSGGEIDVVDGRFGGACFRVRLPREAAGPSGDA